MMIVNTDSFYPLSLVAVGVCDDGGILFINSSQLVLMAVMAMMLVNTRASTTTTLCNNFLQLVLMAMMATMVVNTRASPFVLIDPATERAVQQVSKNFKYTI